MDGRVKTLHPKVHGALLGVLDNKEHQKQAKENDIDSIDLVIINLYPFVETVNKGAKYEEVIENIDIGGPSMIRSAAKNHAFKSIITDHEDYKDLMNEMNDNDNSTTISFRKDLARKAFNNTSNYDQAISSYFNNYFDCNFASKLAIPATLKQELRYGENSHQKAAIYNSDFDFSGIANALQLQGKELSYNNYNDADGAFNLILEFNDPACAIIKHASPCGVATSDNLMDAYKNAFESDSKSAFGGIVALNRVVDEEIAKEISKIFFEVVIAPKFSDEAKVILSKKKNLRLLEVKLENNQVQQFKSISGGVLVQDLDSKSLNISDLKQVSQKRASDEQLKEMVFAMSICKHVKSNAIVITNDFQTVGVGTGQTSRVDSVEIACKKAVNFTYINGSVSDRAANGVLASDAFFPFADGLEYAAKNGVKAFVATSGSIRDEEVIEAADKYGVALYFIETRHFKH
jgi:phosphoribosylaminoimidazolecarboxamide formyltransferase/IMP cyclohydrolase